VTHSLGAISVGGFRAKAQATKIESPYKPHRGMASKSWLIGSGGVKTAEMMNATTMK